MEERRTVSMPHPSRLFSPGLAGPKLAARLAVGIAPSCRLSFRQYALGRTYGAATRGPEPALGQVELGEVDMVSGDECVCGRPPDGRR